MDIHDRIAQWHDGDGAGQELHEYLGLTWDEYKNWIQTGKISKGDELMDYTPEQIIGQLRYPTPPEPGTVVGPDSEGTFYVVLGAPDGTTHGMTDMGRATYNDLNGIKERAAQKLPARSRTEAGHI